MNHCLVPGAPMQDTDGNRIEAHGGGLFYENGVFYWFVENKEFTDGKNGIWTWGIRCYSSRDLYNWKSEGYLIAPKERDERSSLNPHRPIDRPHILRCQKTGNYICWLELSGKDAYFTVLTAPRLLGPYTIVRNRVRPYGRPVGDFDLWQDDKGNGYLFFEHDHSGILATALTPDFLDAAEPHRDLFAGRKPPLAREGICHFTHGGRHYLLTSGMSGYIPNPSEVAVSDAPLGPYQTLGSPHRNEPVGLSFESQVSAVLEHPAHPGLYLALADRWIPDLKLTPKKAARLRRGMEAVMENNYLPHLLDVLSLIGYPWACEKVNTSRATMSGCPLVFEGDTPVINWYDHWRVEEIAEKIGKEKKASV